LVLGVLWIVIFVRRLAKPHYLIKEPYHEGVSVLSYCDDGARGV
jgi:hypothetical protein